MKKFIAVIAVVILLSGCTIGNKANPSKNLNNEPANETTNSSANIQNNAININSKSIDSAVTKYLPILIIYHDIGKYWSNSNTRDDTELQNEVDLLAKSANVDSSTDDELIYDLRCSSFETRKNIMYAIQDLNSDGIPELIILSNNDYVYVHAIFSLIDGSPGLIDAFWSRHSCEISKDGTLYVHSSGGASDNDTTSYTIAPRKSELNMILKVGQETYDDQTGETLSHCRWFRVQNGRKTIISEQEAEAALVKFPGEYPDNITKKAGLTFITLP